MPNDMPEIARILLENRDKNFVQRILSPDKYPVINNEDGSISTHLMASGEADGKGIVFPLIVYDEKTGTLQKMNPDEAADYALKTGQFITLDTPQKADWFTKACHTLMPSSAPANLNPIVNIKPDATQGYLQKLQTVGGVQGR